MSSFTHLGYWKNNLKYLLIKSRVASDHFFKYYYFLQNSGWVYGAQKLQDCGIFT